MKKVEIGLLAILLLFAIVLFWLLVRWFSNWKHGDLALAAAMMFVLLPVIAVGSFWLGKTAARAQVEGLNLGVNAVIDTALRAIEVRSEARQRLKTPSAPINVFFQPAPGAPAVRFLEPGDEVVEL